MFDQAKKGTSFQSYAVLVIDQNYAFPDKMIKHYLFSDFLVKIERGIDKGRRQSRCNLPAYFLKQQKKRNALLDVGTTQ